MNPVAAVVALVVALKDQDRIRSAEAERIRDDAIEPHAVDAVENDRVIRELRIEIFDMRRSRDEAVPHHDEAVDRFLYPGGAKRMTCQGFRRTESGDSSAEHLAAGLDLCRIANRCSGSVCIDVVDGAGMLERHLHTPHRSLTGWRHHVRTV